MICYRAIPVFLLYLISCNCAFSAEKMVKANINDDAPLVKSTDPDAAHFKMVGKLRANLHCTATLIAGEKEPNKDDLALILTAGHCVNDNVSTNEVIINRPVNGNWVYIPDYFIDLANVDPKFSVRVKKVLYASMKNQDVAVLQLEKTYGELKDKGYYPLKLQKRINMTGDKRIKLLHIPIDGINPQEAYLRQSACNITKTYPLLYESSYPWVWSPVVANDCLGVRGGTSGSPVFLDGKYKTIIGVLNTTMSPGLTGCGLGRPCVIENGKGTPIEKASYFIPVSVIADALTDNGTLDFTKLDNNSGNILSRKGIWTTHAIKGEEVQWEIIIDEEIKNIRYKAGKALETNCTEERGYSDAIAVSKQPLENLALPHEDGAYKEGIYKLCVIGQAESGEWQKPQFASVMLREIDNTPPGEPEIKKRDMNANFWEIEPIFAPYEIVNIVIKFGAKNATDCNDKQHGYRSYNRVPLRLEKAKGPWRFCAYGEDLAGNQGKIVTIDLEK